MRSGSIIGYYFHLAIERNTFIRAVRVGIIVGIVLNLINNPGLIYLHSFNNVSYGRVILTFLVPYFVSTYSSVMSNSQLKQNS
jgi:hypothetical protein